MPVLMQQKRPVNEAITKQSGARCLVMPPLGIPSPSPNDPSDTSSRLIIINESCYVPLGEIICASIETTWSHAPRCASLAITNSTPVHFLLADQYPANHFLLDFLFSSKAPASLTANSLVLSWSIHVSRPSPLSLAHGTLTHLAPLSTL